MFVDFAAVIGRYFHIPVEIPANFCRDLHKHFRIAGFLVV